MRARFGARPLEEYRGLHLEVQPTGLSFELCLPAHGRVARLNTRHVEKELGENDNVEGLVCSKALDDKRENALELDREVLEEKEKEKMSK